MTYEQRFMRRAGTDARGFAQTVQQRFGFSPSGVGQLLDMASRLSQPAGATLTKRDVATLQALHPQVHPGDIAAIADRLGQLEPSRRFEMFAGLLADDPAAMYGDRVNATDRFREIEELTRQYTTEEMAESINQRRGGSEVKPAWKPEAWKPEAGSVRALIEQQLVSKPHEQMLQRMNAGDPYAEEVVRQDVANRMDNALDRLEQPEASTHDTLSAAFDFHQGAEISATEFGLAGDNE